VCLPLCSIGELVPLQVSIPPFFLFPARTTGLSCVISDADAGSFWRVPKFFMVAFAGIGFLTLTYISLPVLYSFGFGQATRGQQ